MDDTSWSRWPFYSSNEQEICMSILQSGQVNYWTGKKGRQFEAEFAQYHRLPYAVALSNGTIALELALIGLGVGKGDEVIVTPRTFIASASSIIR